MSSSKDVDEELDMFGEEALGIAGRFKTAMMEARTVFPDVSGEQLWDNLYYSGVIPSIVRFVDREADQRTAAAKQDLVKKNRSLCGCPMCNFHTEAYALSPKTEQEKP